VSKRPKGKTFADIVREVEQQPVVPERDYSGVVDPSGKRWHRDEAEVSPARALELAGDGASVAWDNCGCGGYCGFDWYTPEDVARMVAAGTPEVSRHTKRRRGAASASGPVATETFWSLLRTPCGGATSSAVERPSSRLHLDRGYAGQGGHGGRAAGMVAARPRPAERAACDLRAIGIGDLRSGAVTSGTFPDTAKGRRSGPDLRFHRGESGQGRGRTADLPIFRHGPEPDVPRS
jgi:hypothetical protein